MRRKKDRHFEWYTLRLQPFLLACIVGQTALAGIGLFQDAAYFKHHSLFVKMFAYLPLLMFILTFPARHPSFPRWGCLCLFLLIYVQYATANLDMLGALHPVIALVMFWVNVIILKMTYSIISSIRITIL